jgi:hypothetical protein
VLRILSCSAALALATRPRIWSAMESIVWMSGIEFFYQKLEIYCLLMSVFSFLFFFVQLLDTSTLYASFSSSSRCGQN